MLQIVSKYQFRIMARRDLIVFRKTDIHQNEASKSERMIRRNLIKNKKEQVSQKKAKDGTSTRRY